ncbi:MAG: peptide chain release factor N(5)-glutamine methyltransferase [Blastocatellia bacterium]
MPTYAETLREAAQRLRMASVPNDLLDAQSLLAHTLGQDRTYLIVHYHEEVPTAVLPAFWRFVERRCAGEPLQYITGRQAFFGLDFEVTSAVLIPRPETELIVEEILRLASAEQSGGEAQNLSPLVIDVGTGSGCLAIAIARELPQARVLAVDRSFAALEVAVRNGRRHQVTDRVQWIVGDLLEPVEERPLAWAIVSNPPYLAVGEIAGLAREVREWEPRMALTDGGDGLDFHRRLLREAPSRLAEGGYLLIELGYQQSAAVLEMVDPETWEAPRVLPDLQGIARTLVLHRHRSPKDTP